MTRRIALIACCKSKAPTARAARDLYQGDLFKKARAWAEAHCDAWAILSAEHGLVLPSDPVEPYERTLNTMSAAEREVWALKVNEQVAREFGIDTIFVLLAGKHYRAAFERFNPRFLSYQVPMRGLGLGSQKAWLKANL